MKSLIPAAVALILFAAPAFGQVAAGQTANGNPAASNTATNPSGIAPHSSQVGKTQRTNSTANRNAARNKTYRKLQKETQPSPSKYR